MGDVALHFAFGRRDLEVRFHLRHEQAGSRSWTPRTGPAGETELARMLRWHRDRRSLVDLEPRLLRDVGLTAQDVARGKPFPRRPQDGVSTRPP
jgi:uncharacterized protein YjiS (DUF1127 family)